MGTSDSQPESPQPADEQTGSAPWLPEREPTGGEQPAAPADTGAASDTGSAPPPGSPAAADEAASSDPFAERPELYVGAAFAGGLVLAGLIRILSR